MNVLHTHIDEVRSACRSCQVETLAAFGSVLTDRFTDKSDIDLVVDIRETDPVIYTDHYFELKDRLEGILQRPIDLLEKRAIKNPFLLQELEAKQLVIYAA